MVSENSPKVSIVLPTYNGAKYVKQAVDSCLNQTYKNIELIIVDDCSNDETPRIIDSYKDDRIRYLRHKQNEGLPYALNTGFAKATGQYLTWTSDDNQYLPKAIEELVSLLEKNPDVDFVYADYWAHFLETDERELRTTPDNLDLEKANEVGPCFLFTRRAYKEVGAYDPKYKLVEDYDYWIRICKKFKALHCPHPLYIYGEHSKSLTRTKRVAVKLTEIILKYKNGYISLSGARNYFLGTFYEYISSPSGTTDFTSASASPKKLFLFLQDVIQVSHLSPLMCLLFLISLVRMFTLSVLRLYGRIAVYPFNYIGFLLWSARQSTRLKVTKDRKNILCIVPQLTAGGAEKVLLSLAKEMNPDKFSFHIIATSPKNNVWYDKFKTHFQNVVILKERVKNVYFKYFERLIRKLSIDIVLISHSTIGYEYLPFLRSEFENIKTVDILHAENRPPSNLVQWSTQYVDRRICISQYLKEYWAKRYVRSGMNEQYVERLKVVHNGIDTKEYNADSQTKGKFKSRFSIPDRVKVISYIGRLSDEKNPLLFVEIANNVNSKLPDEFDFVMAGDGPEFEKVRNLIKDYGLKNQFVMTGTIDNVTELLNDTYVLLIVSRIEGIPLVALEAMNMGVPVMSTDVGAVSEVVRNNINGYLINAEGNAAEAFASKIQYLLKAKSYYNRLAENARKTVVPSFSMETMAKQYESIFDELTNVQPSL